MLKTISQPALIVHSRQDRCAGLDNAGYLQRNLRGLVDMVVLGGSHQAASLDRQHDLIVEKASGLRRSRGQTAADRAVETTGGSAGGSAEGPGRVSAIAGDGTAGPKKIVAPVPRETAATRAVRQDRDK